MGFFGQEHSSFSFAPLALLFRQEFFAEPKLSWPMWCTAAKCYDKTMQLMYELLVPGSLS